jgi:hypothetical protein
MARVTCPKCSTTLRLPRDLPAGKRIRCPECETLFRPPAALDDELAGADRRRESSRDDRDDDAPRRPRSKNRRPAKKSNAPLIAGAVLGALLLLVGGAVAVSFLWPEKKEDAGAFVPPPPLGDPPNRPKGAVAGGPNVPPKTNVPPAKGGNRVTGLGIGNLAMEIEAEDIDGQTFKLSDYRGKVVVLDFWGHW